jgi:NAD(P)-dependent dehydrogenase (short-subunit alcohol dehydrogenase family)
MSSLGGKVAAVTGASRGLGRAIARKLHSHGACVVINYYQSRDLAEELVAEFNAGDGRRAISVHAGVGYPDEVQAMMYTAVERFGGMYMQLPEQKGRALTPVRALICWRVAESRRAYGLPAAAR